MAFRLNLGCNEPATVECSYDYSQANRMQYVINRARRAYYFTSTHPTPVGISLTSGSATGFLTFANSTQTITVVAEGCGCPARCTIGNCCIGKDFLRISISDVDDLSFYFERTLPPNIFGPRTIFGSWTTSITGMSGLNGTWMLPVGGLASSDPWGCPVAPMDTGVDVTFTCRWFSTGRNFAPNFVPTSEQWTQDLTGTVTGRLLLSWGDIYFNAQPGTMTGYATKTAGSGLGATGAYNLTFNSTWSIDPFTAPFSPPAGPIINTGNGIVSSYSAAPGRGSGSPTSISLFGLTPLRCGLVRSNPIHAIQYMGESGSSARWVNGEGLQPALHHANTGPTAWPGVFQFGNAEQEYVDVP